MMLSIAILVLLLVVVYLAITTTLSPRSKQAPLPPGPPGKPLIGNLFDLPRPDQQDWQHWLKHKALYGPISSLRILGQTIIIINDAQLAIELLEKRSAIYASRPHLTFAEMAGWDNVLGSVPSTTPRFRDTRKNLHREIGSNTAVARFNSVQMAEVGRFLVRMMEDPREWMGHIRKEAGAIILKVGYGYTVEPHGRDPLVDLADQAMEDFSMAMLPATWMVDFLPFLRHLPGWLMPGGATARRYKHTVTAFSDLPYAFVQQDKRGIPSFLGNLLRESGPLARGSEAETTVKWSAASMYAGGADTTVSSLSNFFLAMARYPRVQRTAQAELDAVCGSDRLPTFADRDNLPYVNALVQEVFRWHPVLPMAMAHTAVREDEVAGYRIPKGASVMANVWAFTHDPSAHPNPEEFRPERFLETNATEATIDAGISTSTSTSTSKEFDPRRLVFGFGRRVCPGRTLAEANVFLTIAQALTVFRIQGPETEEDWTPQFLPGVISHAVPVALRIEPRSERHRELIREVGREYPWEKSQAGELEGLRFSVGGGGRGVGLV